MLCVLAAGVTILLPDLIYRNVLHSLAKRSDHVRFARLPAATAHDPAVSGKHQHGGRAQNVQLADQIEVRFGVNVEMSNTLRHRGHISQDPASRPARRAKGRRELEQRGPLAKRVAELLTAKPLLARHNRINLIACRAEPAVGPSPDGAAGQAERERRQQSR